MTEVVRSLKKPKYTKDTSIETDESREIVILDLRAGGNVGKKKKCAIQRRSFSFKEKALILGQLNTESKASVCDKFGLNDRTLRKWKTKQVEIEKACKKENFQNRKKNRTVANKDLDDALYNWYLQARVNGIPVSGPMLKKKALILNKEFDGSKTFKASDGWLDRWKYRRGVQLLKITNEKLPVDVEAGDKYKKHLSNILRDKQLTRAQVFNFDETGLFYKSLPAKTVAGKTELQASSFKNQKEYVTIGVCCNADGSLKLPLVVIGKSAYPLALKNLSKESLPVAYKNLKNARMDAVSFESWFKNEFVPQVQAFLKEKKLPIKALLIVNNCRAHNFINVGKIEMTFLPPNVTSIIQPLNQGIFETLKRRYKFRLLSSILDAQKSTIRINDYIKKVTIKEMIFWIHDSWTEISSAVIYKCWNKIWLVETRSVATQTDFKFLSESPVGVESEETMIYGKNGTTEGMLKILQRVQGYESTNENDVKYWMTIG